MASRMAMGTVPGVGHQIRHHLAGTARFRAALAALSFLFEQPSPSYYVGTMEEALAQAEAELGERGLPCPSGLDELRRPRKT